MADDFRLVSILNPQTPAGGGIGIADSASTVTSGNVVFSNSNNVSFGLNGSTMTASYNSTQFAGTATSFGGTNVSGSLTLNSGGLSLSLSGLAALTSQSNQAASASNGSFTFQTVGFSNANGVTFGTSAGSIVSASVNTSYRGSNDAIGLNTAQTNVTWTVNSSGLSFNAGGYAGTGTGFGGTNVSGSMTHNSAGLTLSLSAQPVAMSRFFFPADIQMTALSAPINATASLQAVQLPWQMSATRADIFHYQSVATSATGNTYGQVWSVYMGLYTNDTANNRLASVSSGSTATTWTLASNTAGATQITDPAIRPISCPININATPGLYFFAANWSTNTLSSGTATTQLGRTVSMMGGVGIQSASFNMVADYNVATALTRNSMMPQGTFTVGTGLPGSISYSQISMTGAAVLQADLAVMFRAN